MSALWQKLADLIAAGAVRISEHGYDALVDDGLTIDEVLWILDHFRRKHHFLPETLIMRPKRLKIRQSDL